MRRQCRSLQNFFAPLKLPSVNESLGLIHIKREKTNPKTKRSFNGCCLWMSTSRIDIIRFRFRWISFAVTSPQPFLFHIWTQIPFHYTCVIYWKSHIWRFCSATVSGYIYCTVHIMVIAINVTAICFQHKVNFHYFVCGRNPLLRVMFKRVFTQWNEYIYIISYCNASSNGYLATVNRFLEREFP